MKSNKKLFSSKTAKGLVSLITIVILLSSILASSIFYENNITANVVKEASAAEQTRIIITEVNDIKELNQLNEGWYQIVNGYVFYLEHFDSYVPLYIHVKNLERHDALLGIDEEGTIVFDDTFGNPDEFVEQGQYIGQIEDKIAENQITGEVTGLEEVSGFDGITGFATFKQGEVAYGKNNQKGTVEIKEGKTYLKTPDTLFGIRVPGTSELTEVNPTELTKQPKPYLNGNPQQVGSTFTRKESGVDVIYQLKENEKGELFYQDVTKSTKYGRVITLPSSDTTYDLMTRESSPPSTPPPTASSGDTILTKYGEFKKKGDDWVREDGREYTEQQINDGLASGEFTKKKVETQPAAAATTGSGGTGTAATTPNTNKFYVKKSDGTFLELDATNRDDAKKEVIKKFGDPNIAVVSGTNLPAEKKVDTSQQVLEGTKKYVFQYEKGGQILTGTVSAEEGNQEQVASAWAKELKGGTLVAGTVQRPKFTVRVQGVKDVADVEADDAAKAIQEVKATLPEGIKAQFTATQQKIGSTGAAETKKGFRVDQFLGEYVVVDPSGNIVKKIDSPTLGSDIINNPDKYTITAQGITLIQAIPESTDVRVTKYSLDGRIVENKITTREQAERSVAGKIPQKDAINVHGKEITLKDARLITGDSGLQSLPELSPEQLKSINDAVRSGSYKIGAFGVAAPILDINGGVTGYHAIIKPGQTYTLPYGTVITAPKDKEIEVQQTEPGKVWIDGVEHTISGPYIIPEKQNKAGEATVYDIKSKVFKTVTLTDRLPPKDVSDKLLQSGVAVDSAKDTMLVVTRDGPIEISTKGMSENQRRVVTEIVGQQGVEIKPSEGGYLVKYADGTSKLIKGDTIITRNNEGKPLEESLFKGKDKIEIKRTFDPKTGEVNDVSIQGLPLPKEQFQEVLKAINDPKFSWDATNKIISLSNNRNLKFEGDTTILRNGEIPIKAVTTLRGQGNQKIGEEVTEYDPKGNRKTVTRTTETTEVDTTTKDRVVKQITIKDGAEQESTTLERTIQVKDSKELVTFKVETNEKFDSINDQIPENAKITLNGNTITRNLLNELSGIITSMTGLYNAEILRPVSTMITEAKTYGIRLDQSVASYDNGLRTLKSKDGQKLLSLDDKGELQIKEFVKRGDAYSIYISSKTTKKDGIVTEFKCKNKDGCNDIPEADNIYDLYSSVTYNKNTREVLSTSSTVEVKGEQDKIKVEVKYTNPGGKDSFAKNAWISEVKIGSRSFTLDQPNEKGYQFVTSPGWINVYYKDGLLYAKQEKDKLFGEGKEEVYEQYKDKNTLDWQKLIQDAGIEGPDHKRKADSDRAKLYEKERTEALQQTTRAFFATVERVLTEFQGLGYYATLFIDEDKLLAWRETVDRVFATLYLGTEYWSSSICGCELGSFKVGDEFKCVELDAGEGVAYAETPQSLLQVGAHIEATRSEPIITPEGTEFNYRITFNVRNGDYDKDPRAPEEMHVNVILRGERAVTVFKEEQRVKRGSSFGRIGRNAIAKASTAFYNEVCLTFDNTPLRWKVSDNEVCNIIQEASGAPTSVSASSGTASGGGTGTAPSGGINDF